MGFRITTGMMMNTYRYNLQGATKRRTDSADKVLTQRNFTSYAEDPTAATQAFRLRREFYQTSSQIANTKDVYNKFNTAWQNVQGMLKDLINPMEKVSAIRGNNGGTGEARHALAQVLRETSESMIQGFNQQLGDHFIFAGNDGLNVPFEWKGEDLYFRGINVKCGNVKEPTAPESSWLNDWTAGIEAALADPATSATDKAAFEKELEWCKYFAHETDTMPGTQAEGEAILDQGFKNAANNEGMSAADQEGWAKYYMHETKEPPTAEAPAWASGTPDKYGIPAGMPIYSDDPVQAGWIAYYNDKADVAKLKEMSEEEMYIDLGMGAEQNGPNNPVRGSYFNSALSGLNYTGFGTDETDEFGDPNNMAILMRELADVFDTWDEEADPQGYNPDLAKNSAVGLTSEELEAKAFRLMDKLKAAQETLTAEHEELNAQSSFLQTNQERLELQSSNLNMEILDIEQVDLAEAITAFSWDYNCYSAALKIGTQLLSQSLIDYMN